MKNYNKLKREKINHYEKKREKLISTSKQLITLELELVKHSSLKMLKN